MEEVFNRFERNDVFKKAVTSIMSGEKDPYTVSDELIRERLDN